MKKQALLRPDFVNQNANPSESLAKVVTVPSLSPSLESKALPLDWLLDPAKSRSFSNRVLARLVQAEAHEPLAYLKDDIRQAFIVLALAAKGEVMPFVVSSYQMYGVHPDHLYPHILARRKAQLGHEYELWYDAAGNLRPDIPKKLSASQPEKEANQNESRQDVA